MPLFQTNHLSLQLDDMALQSSILRLQYLIAIGHFHVLDLYLMEGLKIADKVDIIFVLRVTKGFHLQVHLC